MRKTLLALPCVLSLGCTGSGDSVENQDPGVMEAPASQPEDTPETPSQAADDESPPAPTLESPGQDDDEGSTPGGASGDDPGEGGVGVVVGTPGRGGSPGNSAGQGGEPGLDTAGNGGTPTSEPDDAGAGGTGECERPLDDYALLGEECDLADFDCENYYRDACGCGCDDVALPDPSCRPDDAYVALGDQCEVVRFVCEEGSEAFFDDCGCGCEPAMQGPADACPEPAESYVLQDPSACLAALFACDEGEETFFDDCGCGCRPVADQSCPAPEGTEIDILPERVTQFSCYVALGEPRVITNEEEYLALTAGCDGAGLQVPDFEAWTVFAAVVPGRPTVDLRYVVDGGDLIVVVVEAEAYCGGAAPPNTVLVLELDPTDQEIVQERCDWGMCNPDLLQP